jgi:hypothetical protein
MTLITISATVLLDQQGVYMDFNDFNFTDPQRLEAIKTFNSAHDSISKQIEKIQNVYANAQNDAHNAYVSINSAKTLSDFNSQLFDDAREHMRLAKETQAKAAQKEAREIEVYEATIEQLNVQKENKTTLQIVAEVLKQLNDQQKLSEQTAIERDRSMRTSNNLILIFTGIGVIVSAASLIYTVWLNYSH